MRIARSEIASLVHPYAVSIFQTRSGPRVIVAPESDGECLSISVDDLAVETIWSGMGGTMNVWQTNPDGEFFAIQRFYKGFNCKKAHLVKVFRRDGGWMCEPFFDLPYLHRFCLIDVAGEPFFVGSTLCADKQSRDDWSQPGATYVMRLPKDLSRPGELKPVVSGLFKNHGFFIRKREAGKTILVSGQEGIFEISPPDHPDGEWSRERIMEREVSDMVFFDIDGDGIEELITIEKFHGARLVVNKPVPGGWKEMYVLPIEFGHALWAGNILGRPSILIGYRGANAALVLLQPGGKRDGDLLMEVTVIDQLEGPANLEVLEQDGVCKIFTCSNGRNRVVLYELRGE